MVNRHWFTGQTCDSARTEKNVRDVTKSQTACALGLLAVESDCESLLAKKYEMQLAKSEAAGILTATSQNYKKEFLYAGEGQSPKSKSTQMLALASSCAPRAGNRSGSDFEPRTLNAKWNARPIDRLAPPYRRIGGFSVVHCKNLCSVDIDH